MDFALARRNMVECQLRTNKIVSPDILAALHSVPRERFVPVARKGQAYSDEHVAIGEGRWLAPAMPIMRLIQEAYPSATDNALVVGAGYGYSAAILGRLCRSVFATDDNAEFVSAMSSVLTDLAADNVVAVEAPLKAGFPKEGPYDIILLDGSVSEVPQSLFDQLAEGGRLMAIVGAPGQIGRAMLYGKRNGAVSHRELFDMSIKALPGFEKEAAFVF
ncbi:protein-L-isoaspartate O-methyltransferase [Rhodospirillaceae bacterium KN72]|uniref:Protein-L-isoaspartate O-methyltransferase n=1 Tax=Pacificispira spongiicola TaxID=2729598 RepID=A0A7Y0E2Q9_9PROT|nr:protein-L-isoaspartate O-methyltransferase [Pacificispira spongiicola]NMM46159.1 protein-L-isoaspartate O-methyltransferase [Pacificispira spongiicola]